MKKLLILTLFLALLLCACKIEIITVPETEEVTVTNAPDVKETDVPKVVSAVKYEKPIVDIVGYGGWEYPHSVEYPKIDSDKPGAIALNEKISEKYEKIITELKADKEENRIYTFIYDTSECDGIIFIRIIEYTGWQYSEGMTSHSVFYYDAKNDCEFTAEEYAAHFGIDLEKAKGKVLYTHELARAYYEDSSVMISGEDENAIYEPAQGALFPAKQTVFDFDFCGIEVIEDTVHLYFGGQMYVYSIYKFALDKATLEPKNPHYRGYLLPNDTSGDIFINLENGVVTSYAIPSSGDVFEVDISSKCVTVRSRESFDLSISINGGEPYSAGGQSYNGENNYQYDYYIDEYIPLENLKTIEFTK